MSHRTIIFKSSSSSGSTLASEAPSPYNITVEYSPPEDATPEQVGAEMKRIMKKIDQIEHGSED